MQCNHFIPWNATAEGAAEMTDSDRSGVSRWSAVHLLVEREGIFAREPMEMASILKQMANSFLLAALYVR